MFSLFFLEGQLFSYISWARLWVTLFSWTWQWALRFFRALCGIGSEWRAAWCSWPPSHIYSNYTPGWIDTKRLRYDALWWISSSFLFNSVFCCTILWVLTCILPLGAYRPPWTLSPKLGFRPYHQTQFRNLLSLGWTPTHYFLFLVFRRIVNFQSIISRIRCCRCARRQPQIVFMRSRGWVWGGKDNSDHNVPRFPLL